MRQMNIVSLVDLCNWWHKNIDRDGVPTLFANAVLTVDALKTDPSIDGPIKHILLYLLNAFTGEDIKLLVECLDCAVVPDALKLMCTWFENTFERSLLQDKKALFAMAVLWDEKGLARELLTTANDSSNPRIVLTETTVDITGCAGICDSKIEAQLSRGPFRKYADGLDCNFRLQNQDNLCTLVVKINSVAEDCEYLAGFLSDVCMWVQYMAGRTPVVVVISLPAKFDNVYIEGVRDSLRTAHMKVDCCTRVVEWLNNVVRESLDMWNHDSGNILRNEEGDTIVLVGTERIKDALSVDTVYSKCGTARKGMTISKEGANHGMRTPLSCIPE